MTDVSYEDEILEQIRRLDLEGQRRVLEFARSLGRPKGEPGWRIVQHAREINFPKDDLAEIQQAIEDFCEQVEDFPEIDFDE